MNAIASSSRASTSSLARTVRELLSKSTAQDINLERPEASEIRKPILIYAQLETHVTGS